MEQHDNRNRRWCPLVDTPETVRYWSAGISTLRISMTLLTIRYNNATVFCSRLALWFKVLPTKFLQLWNDTAGLAVVIVAKLGGTPLYRHHLGYVCFCYRAPYHRSIFKLRTNYELVAFGHDILWAARKISAQEGCSLTGLFRHFIDML